MQLWNLKMDSQITGETLGMVVLIYNLKVEGTEKMGPLILLTVQPH